MKGRTHRDNNVKSRVSLDTGRTLNVHMTFRKHPGGLLNDLHMLNLCSVSMGGFYLKCFSKYMEFNKYAKFSLYST